MSATRPASSQATGDDIIAQFRAAFGELRCIGSSRLVKRGVSMSHLHLMSMLERHGPMPMSRIAELLDVSVSNATGLIDRMEERGFVERVRVPDDRRIVLVRATDAGRQTMTETDVLRDDLLRKILSRLEPAALDRLAKALDDLRVAVVEVVDAEPDLLEHDHQHAHLARPQAAPEPDHASHGRT